MKLNHLYKVLTEHADGRLSSACQNTSFPEHLRVYYTPGEIAFPPKGRLFAFTTYERAKRFTDLSSRYVIYKAITSSKLYKDKPVDINFLKRFQKLAWQKLMKRAKIEFYFQAIDMTDTCTVTHLTITERL